MQPAQFRSLLEAETAAAGLALEPACLDRLTAHQRLLVKWNRAVRLIGDLDPLTIIRRHIIESLRLIPFILEPRGALLDIGSGNGFPAIPLKAALDQLRLVMLEPTVRKSQFLRTVISDLKLSDTTVARERVDKPRDLVKLGRWDCITMRGVAAIPAVIEGAASALRPNGRVLFLVGDAGRREIEKRIQPPLEIVALQPLPSTQASFIAAVELRRP